MITMSNGITSAMGIYMYFYEDTLYYIGKSVNIFNRLKQHTEPWMKEITHVEYSFCETKADMDIYEIYYINKLEPPMNTEHTFSKPSSLILQDLELKRVTVDEFNKIPLLHREKTQGDLIRRLSVTERDTMWYEQLMQYPILPVDITNPVELFCFMADPKNAGSYRCGKSQIDFEQSNIKQPFSDEETKEFINLLKDKITERCEIVVDESYPKFNELCQRLYEMHGFPMLYPSVKFSRKGILCFSVLTSVSFGDEGLLFTFDFGGFNQRS